MQSNSLKLVVAALAIFAQSAHAGMFSAAAGGFVAAAAGKVAERAVENAATHVEQRYATQTKVSTQQAAKVIHVEDGDTVTILDGGSQIRVRLANIDAPEMSHGPNRPGQPFSAAAQKFLSNMVNGQNVQLDCVDKDRYGRSICTIYANGQNANLAIVSAGLAWANTANPSYLRDPAILNAQRSAQSRGAGLWQERSPVEPWNWRHKCWDGGGVCPVTN